MGPSSFDANSDVISTRGMTPESDSGSESIKPARHTQVLAAAVQEVQVVPCDACASLLVRPVVDDGAVGAEPGDGAKAGALVVLLTSVCWGVWACQWESERVERWERCLVYIMS